MTEETKPTGYWVDFNADRAEDDDTWVCGDVCSHGGICTRPEGHEGEHAAGSGNVALCMWGVGAMRESQWETFSVAISGMGVNYRTVAKAWARVWPKGGETEVNATFVPSVGTWEGRVEEGCLITVECPSLEWLSWTLHNVLDGSGATWAHVTNLRSADTFYVNVRNGTVEAGASNGTA